MGTKGLNVTNTWKQHKEPYFDKTSATGGTLINRTWFSHYPHSQNIVYDNGSEFKLHFETLYDPYGLKRKQTSVKNLQANAILERVHQTIMGMLHTAEINMADIVRESDIADFLTNAALAIHSTYHTVLKASPGAALFGKDMLFDVLFIADWKKIGDHWQCQMDHNTAHENKTCVYSLQNREQVWKWSLDYHNISYEWNNQDSMWNKIRMIEHWKSYTILWLIMYWHNYLCTSNSSKNTYALSPQVVFHLLLDSTNDITFADTWCSLHGGEWHRPRIRP